MDALAFDDLKLFARVAALGSLSAAARERGVTLVQQGLLVPVLAASAG